MSKQSILILCTGNSARSQMAEAFFREYAGDRFDVHSAGLEARGINPLTTQVMSEVGIDISSQRSKCVSEYLGRMTFTYVIFVCAHAERQCPRLFPGLSAHLLWPFDDPASLDIAPEDRLRKFREVRDQIDNQIQAWLKGLGPASEYSGPDENH